MCAACVFFGDEFNAHCASLAFSGMKRLRNKSDSDGAIVVNCTSFKREITDKCTECHAVLTAGEWFVFGNKCALHGVES